MEYAKFLNAILWTKAEWGKRKHAPEVGCQKYQDFSYAALRARRDNYWLHLEKMDKAKLEEEIVDCFLNTKRWNCHLPKPDTDKRRKLVCNLKKAVDQLPDTYAALTGSRIEDIKFDKLNMVTIDHIYFCFCDIDPAAFRKVPASKLMHMALPSLFVMWDAAIIKSYRVPKLKKLLPSYTAFLMVMQENIRHIRETNPSGSRMTNEELFKQINKKCGYNNLPITRLLDIANYAVSYKEKSGIDKCSKCIVATNHRLATTEWYDARFKPGNLFL